ncbi:ImmA/IrrE family metallo-endopeptidase [Mesorhizobium sp.]|uniref:ImmA/IrrE family metallo-endopeptidase n=1 Tax=Mesorhizobium sp. TaxID=1871066 RepID=UPI0025C14543|nr:ImmA/IrrE family metallo-endopeptidase [Mesorhizobium sp.]
MDANIMDRLARHQLALPVNIEGAIRDLGIVLKKDAALPPNIAGHIRRLPDGRFEIASTRDDHYFRQRFTMAHELGHFVLHRSLIGEGIDDNIKYRSAADGEFYNTAIDEIHEQQANSFAASLLIPERLLRGYLFDHRNEPLKRTATAFQVSPSAMRWRLKNLGLYQPDLDR